MRLMDRLNPRGEAAWQAGGYATFSSLSPRICDRLAAS
jgi:hypothetical protein